MTPINVTYFKKSGKYYTDAVFDVDMFCVISDSPHRLLSMNRVVDVFRRLCADGNPPGLSQWHAGEFYVLLNSEHGYPVLLKPDAPEF
jgi:hypothetical protein